MSLESFNFIDSLNASNPTTTDNVSEGDDHIRGIKSTLKTTFPSINAAITATDEEINLLDGVTATTAELNYVDGVTSNIQTQLGTKLPLAGGTMTGTIAGFTSTGIDDNATSTAITINAHENVTIETTANDPLIIKSTSASGGYVEHKLGAAGATVGYTGSSAVLISGGVSTDYAIRSTGNIVLAASGNVEDVRITNDGITFNGDTAAANALDDYETGTWTPGIGNFTLNTGTLAYEATYVKIGKKVTVTAKQTGGTITWGTGGIYYINGLPFSASAASRSIGTGAKLDGSVEWSLSPLTGNLWMLGVAGSSVTDLVFTVTYEAA